MVVGGEYHQANGPHLEVEDSPDQVDDGKLVLNA